MNKPSSTTIPSPEAVEAALEYEAGPQLTAEQYDAIAAILSPEWPEDGQMVSWNAMKVLAAEVRRLRDEIETAGALLESATYALEHAQTELPKRGRPDPVDKALAAIKGEKH